MNYKTFNSVIDDIESNLDAGEGYTLNIRTKSGSFIRNRSWANLKGRPSYSGENIIVLSAGDQPPMYLLISEIESMELGS